MGTSLVRDTSLESGPCMSVAVSPVLLSGRPTWFPAPSPTSPPAFVRSATITTILYGPAYDESS